MLVSGKWSGVLISIALIFLGCGSRSRAADPSLERLLRDVSALAEKIGPRPTGSQGDALSRAYILQHFSEAGLETHEDPVGEVRVGASTDIVLDSANVVGVLAGSRPGAILLGAHHDSRSADCPGASDDASGVAVLLEAARRLSLLPRRHTLVFASFTGEETWGLPGSRQFLRNWQGPPILAAVTLDFVGSGKVFVAPFPRPPERWANRLLAEAEARAPTRRVLFDPWLVIVPRILPLSYGADHESFLDAGIPALNLSCQFPAWVYHQPEDRAARIEPATLLATVDLVARMMQRLDENPPPRTRRETDYVPFSAGGRVFFASVWTGRVAAAVLLLLAGWRIFAERSDFFRLRQTLETLRVALVSLPFSALAVSGGFAAELLVRRLAGVQIGWMAHPSSHWLGALAATATTLWMSTGLFRFVRPTIHPGPYLALAILLQSLEAVALTVLGREDLALYFWLAAVGMTASSYSRSTLRRLGWGILGFAFLLPLLSPEAYRMFVELSGASLPPFLLEGMILAIAWPWFLFLQHLACLPQVLLDGRPTRFWGWEVGVVLLGATLATMIINVSRPAYDPDHRAEVRVSETLDLDRRTIEAHFASHESLRKVRAGGWSAGRLPGDFRASLSIAWDQIHPPQLSLETQPVGEDRLVRLAGSVPGSPRMARLRLRSRDPFQVWRAGAWQTTREYERVTLPQGGQVLDEVRLRLAEGTHLELEGEVRGDRDLLGLNPVGPHRVFRFSSRILLSGRIP